MAYLFKKHGTQCRQISQFLHTIYENQRVCGLDDIELDFFFGSYSFPVGDLDGFFKSFHLL